MKHTATVYIHGGDYDCSEAVRMCYRAVGVLPYGSYMWTGNELELLKANGFREIDFGSIGDGDVLWKNGHTEMYLAGGYQGGARIDEVGGKHGPKQGDQTGGEIARSKFVRSNWTKALRYFGAVTVDGIPARFAAAQVMNHLIDHAAHGYSQDNRKGDGTLEAVQITWDGEPDQSGKLDVDGWVGHDTIWDWQEAMHTPLDGELWGQVWANARWFPAVTCKVRYDEGSGSALVRAVQRFLGVDPDGIIGPNTVLVLQNRLRSWGYDLGSSGADKVLGRDTGRALQRSLNDGKWDQ